MLITIYIDSKLTGIMFSIHNCFESPYFTDCENVTSSGGALVPVSQTSPALPAKPTFPGNTGV